MAKKPVTTKQQNEEIKKAVVELREYRLKFKDIESQYKKKNEELQKKIREFMKLNEFTEFKFLSKSKMGDIPLRVLNVVPKSVNFDVKKLKEKLDREIFNEVVNKEYVINDFQGLVKYLKKCGVDPKKFKTFIDVTETVDTKKLDELGSLGEISEEDIDGCYEVTERNGFVKITELEE